MKGKEQETGIPSRLSKASFFRRFMKILEDPNISLIEQQSANNIETLDVNGSNIQIDLKIEAVNKRKELCSELSQYCVAKQAASKFQANKMVLFEAFKKEQLGTWVKKPMEQDEFMLEEISADNSYTTT